MMFKLQDKSSELCSPFVLHGRYMLQGTNDCGYFVIVISFHLPVSLKAYDFHSTGTGPALRERTLLCRRQIIIEAKGSK